MTIKYYPELIQGSDEWLEARCGLLTASEMKFMLAKKTNKKTEQVTWEVPDNDKVRGHLWELTAQRITRYVEPTYIGDDMLRGIADEVEARILYDKTYEPVTNMGFITNDRWGFKLGYSPDGLVGKKGAIECKSRRQKFQVETIINDEVPDEFVIQLQTGLLVSECEWIDFVTYSAGLPMMTKRVKPDPMIQAAILMTAQKFENDIAGMIEKYEDRLSQKKMKLIPTERIKEEELEE